MKNKLYFLASILLLSVLSICIYACKKEKQDKGCAIGGLDSSSYLMFWVSKDYGGGGYTVQVKDENGNIVKLNSNQITAYDFSEPSACDASSPYYSKHALAALPFGHTYTWTAVSDNRSFKGTITIPCDDTYSCKSIEIDQNYQ